MYYNDDLLFLEDDVDNDIDDIKNKNWKILIVDDEEDVHTITKMVLKDVVFDNKGLEFFDAFSSFEAKKILSENFDLAIVFVDIVMEKETSGLELIKYIREELKNNYIRIIIRTGQPGQAPQEDVIINYDINDYKEKTELTSKKLFSTVIAGLRSYRDIANLDYNNKGLEQVLSTISDIFNYQNVDNFLKNLFNKLNSFFYLKENNQLNNIGIIASLKDNSFQDILYITKNTDINLIKNNFESIIINNNISEKGIIISQDELFLLFDSSYDKKYMIYIKYDLEESFNDTDIKLFELLYSNAKSLFNNMMLNSEIEDTQKEIIYTLGEIVEGRSNETGYHIRRVAEYSKLLALNLGFSEEEAEMIKMASPMHDVGKIAISDKILLKPGKLTESEYEIMKTHAEIGYNMLKNSKRKILKLSAQIAREHHEKWDGSGYPRGLSGENISLYGRIVALVDVFDALSSNRVYRKAMDFNKVLEIIKEGKGKHFDPKIVDIFFNNLDNILKIREKYSD